MLCNEAKVRTQGAGAAPSRDATADRRGGGRAAHIAWARRRRPSRRSRRGPGSSVTPSTRTSRTSRRCIGHARRTGGAGTPALTCNGGSSWMLPRSSFAGCSQIFTRGTRTSGRAWRCSCATQNSSRRSVSSSPPPPRGCSRLADQLARGWPRRKAVRATVGHSLEFGTWRSLVLRQGLSRRQAVDAMVRLVVASGS